MLCHVSLSDEQIKAIVRELQYSLELERKEREELALDIVTKRVGDTIRHPEFVEMNRTRISELEDIIGVLTKASVGCGK